MTSLNITSGQYDFLIKTIAESEIKSISSIIGDDQELGEIISDSKNVEDEAIEAFLKDSLWKQVDELPDQQGEILHLKFQQERTLEEIADLKKISLNTVIAAAQSAYRRLRTKTDVKQLAVAYGYDSYAAYHDGYTQFKQYQTSNVERIAIKRVQQNEFQKNANNLMDEILLMI